MQQINTDGGWIGTAFCEEQKSTITAMENLLAQLVWGATYKITALHILIWPLFPRTQDEVVLIDTYEATDQDPLAWVTEHINFLIGKYDGLDPAEVDQTAYQVDCPNCGLFPVGYIGWEAIKRYYPRQCPQCGFKGVAMVYLEGGDHESLLE